MRLLNILTILSLTFCCSLFGSPRTLVIILGETRAHELTFHNFKSHVLDELQADLALCIGVGPNYSYDNPFWKAAKYKFTYEEPNDYGPYFDLMYRTELKRNPPTYKNQIHWRRFLQIPEQFMGGILDNKHQHSGSAGILLFCRWFLLHNLISQNLLNQYDYFVITRSDYIYCLPHPKTSILSSEHLYIPDGEYYGGQYGGLTDRHVILPRQYVVSYLNILNNFVTKGRSYFEKMKLFQPFNLERLIAFHLKEEGVFNQIRFFPYVMYTVREMGGTTRWTKGTFYPDLGYYVKYTTEYASAERFAEEFSAAGLDIDTFYKSKIF